LCNRNLTDWLNQATIWALLI